MSFAPNFVFIIGNKRNRQSRVVESQSRFREENTPETRFVHRIATSTNVSEQVDDIFDRISGSLLTETSRIVNEIDIISQRLAVQTNTKMGQIEVQLNNKFEEILREIRAIENNNSPCREKDAENTRPVF